MAITPGNKRKKPTKPPKLSYIIKPLRHLAVPIDSLTLDPANVRTHDERNLEAIGGSLQRFGQRQPILVQKQGMVIRAGNGRVMAARELGWTHIAAIIVDESDVEATAYAIADNRTAELAGWDEEALAKIYESLPAEIQAATGFLEAEIEALLEPREDPDDDDGDGAPGNGKDKGGDDGPATYQVIAVCKDEHHQEQVYELLRKRGIDCRVSTLY